MRSVLSIWLAAWLAAGAAFAADESVRVSIHSPTAGGTLRDHLHQARIEGSALAEAAGPEHFDVMLVIDVSDSTKVASGADVDGDGEVGIDPYNELLPPGVLDPKIRSTDPEDTILQAQIRAARGLLAGLDARRVRVGLVSFAGEVSLQTGERKRIDQQDAWLELPLSEDYRALDNALAGGHRGENLRPAHGGRARLRLQRACPGHWPVHDLRPSPLRSCRLRGHPGLFRS
jgi:hypothetical protein